MKNLFNYEECIVKDELMKYDEPWKVISHISEIIEDKIKTLNKSEYIVMDNNVYIHKTCVVDKSCHINGPCIIGEKTEF